MRRFSFRFLKRTIFSIFCMTLKMYLISEVFILLVKIADANVLIYQICEPHQNMYNLILRMTFKIKKLIPPSLKVEKESKR